MRCAERGKTIITLAIAFGVGGCASGTEPAGTSSPVSDPSSEQAWASFLVDRLWDPTAALDEAYADITRHVRALHRAGTGHRGRGRRPGRIPRQPVGGREHLLVALASQGEPTLVAVIPDAGPTLSALLSQQSPEAPDHADAQARAAVCIDLEAIRASVAETIGPDAWAEGAPGRRRPSGLIARLLPDHRTFTPGARKALELALREAIAEGSREITATHLLRGLLREPGPHVMAILDPDLVAELRSRLHRPAA